VISGPAIAEQARFLSREGEPADAAAVFRAAGRGHPQALALVNRVSAYLARAIHGLAMSYDVERIVIGGGVSAAGDAFWLPLSAQLAALRAQSALAAVMLPPERITVLPAGMNPGVLGALTLAREAAGEVISLVTDP
jgi:glucokinase